MTWSIRVRLSLWYSALVLAVLVTATIVVLGVQARSRLANLDAELQRLELTVQAVMLNEFGEGLDLTGAAKEASTEVITPGRSVVIARTDGAVVRTWGAPLPAAWQPTISVESAGQTIALAGSSYRTVVRHVSVTTPAFVVAVLADMAPLQAEQSELFRTLGIGMAVALLVAAVGGLLVGKRALRPLSEMAHQAELIGERNLDTRVSSPNPRDELGRLAVAFNGLLGRLERALSSQRQFMADASHQLRTPVSVLRTTSDVTLRRPHRPEDDYREALGIVGEQSVRLARLVDAMFLLSRAEAGGRTLRPEPVYLDEIVHDCVRALTMIASERGVKVVATGATDVAFVGDEELLRQMFTNLLDNAIGHTRADGQVTVEICADVQSLIVRIVDQGPGISTADRDRIFERFTRLDTSRRGAGLGLPIARWIAEAHWGKLDLESSTSEGSIFVVTLPRPRDTTGRDSEPVTAETSRALTPLIPSRRMPPHMEG
jgi:two-component system, OmpR family, sensor kinase